MSETDGLVTMCIPIERYNVRGWPVGEYFAPIDGFPEYMASNYGRIIFRPAMKIMPIHIRYSTKKNGRSSKPYIECSVAGSNGKRRDVQVGRLVLMAFDPRPSYNGLECNHINLDTMNNYLWNLEWTTHKENVQDYYRNVNPASIMPDETVHKICQGLEKSMRFDEIAKYAGLEYSDKIKSYIASVRAGTLRTDISRQYNFPEKRRNTAILANPEIERVCQLIVNRYTTREIAVALGKDFPAGTKEYKSIYRVIHKIRTKSGFCEISDKYFKEPIFVDASHNICTMEEAKQYRNRLA